MYIAPYYKVVKTHGLQAELWGLIGHMGQDLILSCRLSALLLSIY